ncbi:TetR/AcrR family transcriptional regulator [Kibdelosporangium phytohabitans]|uniref:TetR family transcriptional regulator n=1 Tax=Kibdelosporangium phytohabitans TaxID=860235 RepID=A0A0N9I0S0_9PSEU|nr:TetR/AcrR family transcriptional regulator [Kibdelosporangium phytohabitans]ALG09420.1 TetR family transcriptional regulator [Kibdelosporangium phytohabitans]MBE1469299.1 AcrR family transcriptional regulator [Kibdelosporangium phytohabitans]
MSKAQRRERILAVAAEVFATTGYAAAGMREVADAAGISTPVLYDHFASKADLYATLMRLQVDSLVDDWSAPPEPVGTYELLLDRVTAVYSWIERNRAAWRMIFGEPPGDEAVARAYHHGQQRATAQLASLFRLVPRLNLSVDLDRDRADEVLAEAAKSALNAIATWWWRNQDIPREHVVALTADLLWRGLRELTDNEEERT